MNRHRQEGAMGAIRSLVPHSLQKLPMSFLVPQLGQKTISICEEMELEKIFLKKFFFYFFNAARSVATIRSLAACLVRTRE